MVLKFQFFSGNYLLKLFRELDFQNCKSIYEKDQSSPLNLLESHHIHIVKFLEFLSYVPIKFSLLSNPRNCEIKK